MRLGLSILALATMTNLAYAETIGDNPSGDPVEAISREDPAMAEAAREARATLPAFLAASRDPKPGTGRYAVKVGLGENGRREFFWLDPFAVVGDTVIGQLANTPEVIEGYKKGDKVTLPLTRVTDWMYVDNGVMKGNFSACVLIGREDPATRAELEQRYHLDCSGH